MERKSEYYTEQRKLILQYLKENNDKYVNSKDILQYMKKNNKSAGLTTIYRYLNLLEKQGKVRTEIINHTKLFQYILEDCKNHYHLKCEKCGKIIHFDCEEFEKFSKHILKKHKFIINTQAEIYGLCEKCLKN